MRLALILLHSLLLALVTGCAEHAPECPHVGPADYAPSAGCLGLVHGRALVVQSRMGVIGPPGGSAREGESAQCTAHRETLEETGLDLMPGRLLHTFDTGFNLYLCNIHAGSGAIDPVHISEVKQAFWLPVDEFDQHTWRFEGQGEALSQLLLQLATQRSTESNE
ncbi:MAG: NUDIX hydrolase [Halioglobus sp.]